jgi:hypothetical protein
MFTAPSTFTGYRAGLPADSGGEERGMISLSWDDRARARACQKSSDRPKSAHCVGRATASDSTDVATVAG